jgi:hypothetical protein
MARVMGVLVGLILLGVIGFTAQAPVAVWHDVNETQHWRRATATMGGSRSETSVILVGTTWLPRKRYFHRATYNAAGRAFAVRVDGRHSPGITWSERTNG